MSAWLKDDGVAWLVLIVFCAGAGTSIWTGSFAWVALSLVVCGLAFLWLYTQDHSAER